MRPAVVRALRASLTFFVLCGAAFAAADELVAPPSAPPQAAEAPKVATRSGSKARKWRSRRKERAAKKASLITPVRPDAGPIVGPASAPPPLTVGALKPMPAPEIGKISPIVAAAAVSLPPAFVGPLAHSVTTPSLEAADLALTADKIRKSWLLASTLGPPAMGVAVATLSAVQVGGDHTAAPAPAAEVVSPGNSSVWDTHLPEAAVAGGPAASPFGKVRVFGHLAVNHWQGEKNVGARAGPRGGTTNIWDAAVGVETRIAEDMELRVRALTILPAVSADGDGAGAGFPGGAVNFKDFLYMRDVYLGVLNIAKWKQLNLRIGRVPIAFGDEYKQYDSPENPLISHSVPFFWGFDEGLQFYGNLSPDISYQVSAFLDGELGNGSDETASKALGGRIEGNHGGHWHWSLSYMDCGKTGAITKLPSLYFGRELAAPVGLTGAPGGASTRPFVETEWWEGDFRYNWSSGYLALARGGGNLHDDNVHDREFEWFKVEPFYKVARKWDLVSRYSGMNVKNPRLGYRFNSFETVGTELNFDVNERQRLSVGTRYRANEAVSFKLERTIEQWKLIPTPLVASRNAGTEHRDYTVLQACVSF